MERFTITGVSSAADTNGFAATVGAVTPGTTLFALSATEVGDSLAHKVIITPSGSVTGSYVITSTDANGFTQTETLATNTTNAVTSSKYHLTLTSVKSPAGLGAETVDIGWTADSVSAWTYPQPSGPEFNIGFACIKDSGTPTYGVQQTYDNGTTAFNHSTVTGETTSQEGVYTSPVQGYRLNWTAAGGVTMWAYQVALK